MRSSSINPTKQSGGQPSVGLLPLPLLLLLLLLLLPPCLLTLASVSATIHPAQQSSCESKCFRAAVYQHSRLDRRELGCQLSVQLNLDVYEKVAHVAGQHNANIIVFPEDGLFVGSRSFILPCLHELPDPELVQEATGKPINPCLEGNQYDNILMKRLSCMARKNKLFLVANFGTREQCSEETTMANETTNWNTSCDKYGYLMLNTNVVFDEQGNFIKRYRKYNPFVEVFDKAPKLELAYFDTDNMGRFGLFTCFDILFRSPAIDLVEKYNVNTVLYPTWWFDKLPMLSAIQYQEAWSHSNHVNLLAANLVLPGRGSVGSGIFSSNNQTNPIYAGAHQLEPVLIVADLPVARPAAAANQHDDYEGKYDDEHHSTCSGENDEPSGGFKLNVDLADLVQRAASSGGPTSQAKVYKPYGHFEATDPKDVVVELNKNQDNVTVCLADLCCHLDYQISSLPAGSGPLPLVLIVKSGPNKPFRWWEQVCLLATTTATTTTATTIPANSKGHQILFDLVGRFQFSRLSIRANFTTKYVMPIANRNVSQLVERTERRFACSQVGVGPAQQTHCEHELAASEPAIISSFGFFARYFERDEKRGGSGY